MAGTESAGSAPTSLFNAAIETVMVEVFVVLSAYLLVFDRTVSLRRWSGFLAFSSVISFSLSLHLLVPSLFY